MMWHLNLIRPTIIEKWRINTMMDMGCILSRWRRAQGLQVPEGGEVECHHLVQATRRLGHWYTIPLNVWYHRGIVRYCATFRVEARELYGASLVDGRKAFAASHGITEIELWNYLQGLLGMSAEMPASKIMPRRNIG